MSNEDKLRRALEQASFLIDEITDLEGREGMTDADFAEQVIALAHSMREQVREALAATQEPARFNGEKAIADFEAKHPRPNWLQGDNETIREWRDGDPMPAAKK